MNEFLFEIWTLQDKVNTLYEEKEFYDPEAASSSGMSRVPSQPSTTPDPRGMLQEMFLKAHLLQDRDFSSLQELHIRQEGFRREPQSSTKPSPRLSRNLDAWNSTRRSGGNYFKIAILFLAFSFQLCGFDAANPC